MKNIDISLVPGAAAVGKDLISADGISGLESISH